MPVWKYCLKSPQQWVLAYHVGDFNYTCWNCLPFPFLLYGRKRLAGLLKATLRVVEVLRDRHLVTFRCVLLARFLAGKWPLWINSRSRISVVVSINLEPGISTKSQESPVLRCCAFKLLTPPVGGLRLPLSQPTMKAENALAVLAPPEMLWARCCGCAISGWQLLSSSAFPLETLLACEHQRTNNKAKT